MQAEQKIRPSSNRVLVLFLFGFSFSLLFNCLQFQHNITTYSKSASHTDFRNHLRLFTLSFVYGLSCCLVGLSYPLTDSLFNKDAPSYSGDWSTIIRLVASFIGINHTVTKISFAHPTHLSLVLAALSLGVWFLFDRSFVGFLLGLFYAFLATALSQFIVYQGIYSYRDPDFIYIRSWLPCLFFSGSTTIGNIARQLQADQSK